MITAKTISFCIKTNQWLTTEKLMPHIHHYPHSLTYLNSLDFQVTSPRCRTLIYKLVGFSLLWAALLYWEVSWHYLSNDMFKRRMLTKRLVIKNTDIQKKMCSWRLWKTVVIEDMRSETTAYLPENIYAVSYYRNITDFVTIVQIFFILRVHW